MLGIQSSELAYTKQENAADKCWSEFRIAKMPRCWGRTGDLGPAHSHAEQLASVHGEGSRMAPWEGLHQTGALSQKACSSTASCEGLQDTLLPLLPTAAQTLRRVWSPSCCWSGAEPTCCSV